MLIFPGPAFFKINEGLKLLSHFQCFNASKRSLRVQTSFEAFQTVAVLRSSPFTHLVGIIPQAPGSSKMLYVRSPVCAFGFELTHWQDFLQSLKRLFSPV